MQHVSIHFLTTPDVPSARRNVWDKKQKLEVRRVGICLRWYPGSARREWHDMSESRVAACVIAFHTAREVACALCSQEQLFLVGGGRPLPPP